MVAVWGQAARTNRVSSSRRASTCTEVTESGSADPFTSAMLSRCALRDKSMSNHNPEVYGFKAPSSRHHGRRYPGVTLSIFADVASSAPDSASLA